MSLLRGLKALEEALEGFAESFSRNPVKHSHVDPSSGINGDSRNTCLHPSAASELSSPLQQRFTLSPPSNRSRFSLLQFYSNIMSASRVEAIQLLPSVPSTQLEAFCLSLEQETQAHANLEKAQKALEQVSKSGQQQEIDAAKENLNHAQIVLDESTSAAIQIALPLLDHIIGQLPAVDHLVLPRFIILINATPQHLSQYASEGPTQFDQVQNLIQNPNLMRDILEANGPKNNNYAEALRIYHAIVDQSTNLCRSNSADSGSIFHRLALAAALEFSEPIHIFDTIASIDPIGRYFHYEAAYIEGALDPCFSSLSTTELRMVVDNNASNEEISWCRSMLRNYRPDLTLIKNYYWKYCMIVKTDVRYKCPEWTSSPKTYQQLLSGGGKCGPRAWFGRFVCKAFGVPTWGIRQPGHAALSHWMPPDDPTKDWAICLGGPNWKKSYWDDVRGEDFSMDMKARVQGSTGRYGRVLQLLWISKVLNEETIDNQSSAFKRRNVNDRLWSELSCIQKRILAQERFESFQDSKSMICKDPLRPVTIEERIHQNHATKTSCQVHVDHIGCIDGVITIPAACHKPYLNGSQKVIVMKSYLMEEGNYMQVHLRGDECLEYEVNLSTFSRAVQGVRQYALSLRVVNVSSDSKPLRLTMTRGNFQDSTAHKIIIPYTRGEWRCTNPVLVELHGGELNKITFQRDDANDRGLSIKDIVLKPLEEYR